MARHLFQKTDQLRIKAVENNNLPSFAKAFKVTSQKYLLLTGKLCKPNMLSAFDLDSQLIYSTLEYIFSRKPTTTPGFGSFIYVVAKKQHGE